jgi:hypothetical protein
MARLKVIIIMTFFLAAITAIAVLPEDSYIVGEIYTQPGRRTYVVTVQDVNGNYEGNFLRIKLIYDPPEGISSAELGGVSVWEEDPNYLVIDNAKYDGNSADPNLYGHFTITKNWGHRDHELGFRVFDAADNNSCGVGYVYSRDKGRPKVDKFEGRK